MLHYTLSNTWVLLVISALIFMVVPNSAVAAYSPPLFTCGYIGAIASNHVPPPGYKIDLSSRDPALDIKIRQVNDGFSDSMISTNKGVRTSMQEGLEVSIRLFNSKTNETIKDITYFVNITGLEPVGNDNRGNEKKVHWEYFRSDKVDTLWLDVWSSGSTKYATWGSTSSYSPSYLFREEQGKIHMISSELLKHGKYHAQAQVMGVNSCINSEDNDRILKVDRHWTFTIKITSILSSCHNDELVCKCKQ